MLRVAGIGPLARCRLSSVIPQVGGSHHRDPPLYLPLSCMGPYVPR